MDWEGYRLTRFQIPLATGNLRDPVWSPDGDTLYYIRGDSVYAVEVDGSGDAFVAGKPEAVLARETDEGTLFRLSVHPDGRLAVILRPTEDEADDDAPPPPAPRAWSWSTGSGRCWTGSRGGRPVVPDRP